MDMTLTKAKELRERRREAFLEADEIINRAQRAARSLTDDEKKKIDALHDEIESLGRDIKRIERQDEYDREFSRSAGVISGLQDGEERYDRFATYGDDMGEVRPLGDGETVRSFIERTRPEQAEEYRGLSAGRFLRAMVTRPQTEQERRALGESMDSAGGYTVPDILSAEIIDNLRAASVTRQAGARIVPLDSDKHSFAKLLSDPIATWRAEHQKVEESDPTFGRVLFEPKSLAVLVKVSRELLEDSLNIEQALLHALRMSLALEIDRVALMGTGTGNEPRGITNTEGITTLSMGENGAPLVNYDPLLRARGALLAANAGEPTAYIMSPRTATDLSLLKTGLQGDQTQLSRPAELSDLRRGRMLLTTTAIPTDEEHGTADNATRIITGNFRDLWIGMRTEIRIEVLREAFAENLQYAFLAFLRADIGVVRPQSFAQIIGITPGE